MKLIKILKELLLESESTKFSNWIRPSIEDLRKEFEIEQIKKGNEFFEDEEDFLKAVKEGREVVITPSEDKNIDYRSHTEDENELLSLLKTYRSWGKPYRNEETVKAIYDGFKQNKPMALPVVIQFKNGNKRVFSGNTRMDAAFQLGINPKVLLVKSNSDY